MTLAGFTTCVSISILLIQRAPGLLNLNKCEAVNADIVVISQINQYVGNTIF